MKKLLTTLLICCSLLIALVPIRLHAENSDRVVDQVGVLSYEEEQKLENELAQIYNRDHFDIVLLMVDGTGYKSMRDYAADFYDYNGYGYGNDWDGLIFLLDYDSRQMHIVTTGLGYNIFGQWQCDAAMDAFLDNQDYSTYYGLKAFVNSCQKSINEYYNPAPSIRSSLAYKAAICGVGSLIIALIICAAIAKKNKSVARRYEASGYSVPGSFGLTQRSDIYLYTSRSRSYHPRDNNRSSGGSPHYSSGPRTSSFRSSSGRSHGSSGSRHF